MIYFVRKADGTGPIKIGCSSYPGARVKQITIDTRIRFVLLAEVEGSFTEEQNLHRKFAALRVPPPFEQSREYRIGGYTEWFSASEELLSYIRKVSTSGRIELSDEERKEVVILSRRDAGETYASIARDYGVSRQRIHQFIREHEASARKGMAA